MGFDADAFARKNAAMSKAWELDKKDKEPSPKDANKREKEGVCDSCKKERPLRKFRVNTTDRNEGSASFHIDYKWLCDDCAPSPRKQQNTGKTQKELKSMLRAAKRGLR